MRSWKQTSEKSKRKNRRNITRKISRRAPRLENLENRQLLAALVVNSSADSGAGSLREAIATANANKQADTISFAPGISSVTLTSGELVLTETGAANRTSISGPVTINGNNNSRIFNVKPGVALELDKLTLTKGRTSSRGGAIYTEGALSIKNSTLTDNEAHDEIGGKGGAIQAERGVVTIVNSTLSNNRASRWGGAIDNPFAKLTIINSTITGNRTDTDDKHSEVGGGIAMGGSGGTTSLFNTIVAGNFRGSGSASDDLAGDGKVDKVSANNVVGNAIAAGGLTNGTNGNVVGNNGSGILDINTILDTTLKDNGGGVPTHALAAGSAAIDSGRSGANTSSLTLDQRGKPRIDGNGIDAGAFEFESPDAVNNSVEAVIPGFVQRYVDVTTPGDPIQVVGGSDAFAHGVSNAIDNAPSSKTVIHTKKDGGVIVTPRKGASTVTALKLTTSDDEANNDPASYKLEGANSPNGPFTVISRGSLTLPGDRLAGTLVNFSNSTAYTSYRLTFPTIRDSFSGYATQIGEVEFLSAVEERIRFVSSGDFTTSTVNGQEVKTSNGSVQIGLVPTSGQSFVPRLVLRSGVRVTTDSSGVSTFSTGGFVSTVSGGQVLDLFSGTVDGDDTQRVLIPVQSLFSTTGYIIDRKLANTIRISKDNTFAASSLKLRISAEDVTAAGDQIVTLKPSYDSQGPVSHAIDNSPTPYRDGTGNGSGFVVTPASGGSVVTGIRLTTSASSHGDDPISYKLDGSNSPTGPFTPISNGSLKLPLSRNTTAPAIHFSNTTQYSSYRLTFPNVKYGSSANLQVAEVELLRATQTGIELAGNLGFGALGAAGLRLEGANSLHITPTRISAAAFSGVIPVVPSSVDSKGNPAPLSFEIAGLPFVGNAKDLTATFNASTNVVELTGPMSAVFDGGSIDVNFGSGQLFLNTVSHEFTVQGVIPVTALTVGAVQFEKLGSGLVAEFDKTQNTATIRGAALATTSAFEFGKVGFAVDADSGDSDTRVGSALVIKNGAADAFSLPLQSLNPKSGRFAFRNHGADLTGHMAATYVPNSGEFKITGKTIELTQDLGPQPANATPVPGREKPVHIVLQPDSNGLRFRNGQLASFDVPVQSVRFPLSAEELPFTTIPGPSGKEGLVGKFDSNTGQFVIIGKAKTQTRRTNGGITGEADVHLGGKGTTGLVLTNQSGARNLDYAISEWRISSERIEGGSLVGRFEPNSFVGEFFITGQGTWLTPDGKSRISVVPENNSSGYLFHFVAIGTVHLSGLPVTATRLNARPVNPVFGLGDGSASQFPSATIVIEGKTVAVQVRDFYSSPTMTAAGNARMETAASFPIDGINVKNTGGVVEFPNTQRNSTPHFAYTTNGKVDFQVGDIKTKATISLPLDLRNGELWRGKGSTLNLDGTSIQNITFQDGDLKATYSERDRRYVFEGTGRYLGITPVKIGGDPKNAQLTIENGTWKLTNFTPPKVDIVVSGVTVPTKGLVQKIAGDTVTFTGSKTIDVGGARITVELGGGGTNGLVFNSQTGAIQEFSGTLSGTFTVGGVEINAAGTISYITATKELRITGAAKFTFNTTTGPITVDINLGHGGTPGLVIKNGQVQSIQASISSSFKLFGLEIDVQNAGFSYDRVKQVYGFFGSVQISTPDKGGQRILDKFSVTLGAPNAPGLVIQNGEVEMIDVALNGAINLFGINATPENLRVVYTRSADQLAITGGLTVTLGGKFTAKAAFPGRGLLIDTRTGEVQIKGLHLRVGDVQFGKLGIENLEFIYVVDDQGNTTITGNGTLSLPAGLEVDASVVLKNNRLSSIRFKLSRSPGIPVGHPPVVFLNSIEGEVQNLNNLDNFSVKATVTASIGPSVKIFGQSRGLVEFEGSLFVNKNKMELNGKVELLEGLFGNGNGKIEIFFTGREVARVNANFNLYPGGIFRGDMNFTMDRSFNITLNANMGVYVPDGIAIIGGKSLGTLGIHLQIRPQEARSNSFVSARADITIAELFIKVKFDGYVEGYADPPVFSKQNFGFFLPGARDLDFLLPLSQGDFDILEDVGVPAPELTIDSVAPIANTAGATITYTGRSHLPDDTTIDLFVDTADSGYTGELIASSLPFQTDQQTFNWNDLAAFAPVPYDPNQRLYVYGLISDGSNLPVFTGYSAAITPPDFTPTITAPNEQNFNAGSTFVFSTANGNSLQIADPLETALPDSMIGVNIDVSIGELAVTNFSDVVTVVSTDPSSIRLEGKATDINSVLNGLTYTPLENTFFDDSLEIQVGRFPEFYVETIGASMNLKAHPLWIEMAAEFALEDSISVPGGSSDTNSVEYIKDSGPATVLDRMIIHGMASGRLTGASITINNYERGKDLLSLDILDQLDHGIDASFDATEGVLTLSGAEFVQTYERALHTVMFDSMGSGNKSLTVRLGDDVGDQAEFTAPITMKTVNQAPVVDPGQGLSYVQGSGAQKIVPTISVSDPEDGMLTSAVISIGTDSFSQTEDVLHFDDQNGISGQFDSATGVLTLTGSASATVYTAALQSVRYESLAPVSWQNQAYPPDTNVDGKVSAMDALVVINRLIASGESHLLTGSPGQVLPDTSGDGYLSATDALQVINFLHRQADSSSSIVVTVPPVIDPSGVHSLSITVSDGKAINGQTTQSLRLVELAVSKPLATPEINLPTSTAQAATDNMPSMIAPDLTLGEGDSPTLVGAEIKITEGHVAGSDVLHVVGLPEGITSSFDDLTGTLQLRGEAPVSYYEYALQNVTYANRATVRSGIPRKVTFSVNDGVTQSQPITVNVQPKAVPVVKTSYMTLEYTTGKSAEAIDPNVTVMYMGNSTLSGAEVALAWGFMPGQDRLVFTEQNGITGSFDAQTGVMTLSGTASAADYQAALRTVQYTNTRVNPIAGLREVTFQVQDGQEFSQPGLSLINIDTEHVAPTISLDISELTFVENSDPMLVAETFSVTEQDAPMADGSGILMIEGASIRIDGYVPGEDVLSFTPYQSDGTDGGTVTDPDTGIETPIEVDIVTIDGEFDSDLGELFLFGHASLPEYQAVIRSVTYENVSEAPTVDPRHIMISLQQGAMDGEASAITVNIQSLNNPPTRTTDAPGDVTILENAVSSSLGLEDVSYDPPSDKEPELVFTIETLPGEDLGQIRFDDGTVAEVGGIYTADLIHTATFIPALNAAGESEFSFTVAGFNPILGIPDPAHLSESITVQVVGVETDNPADAFVAQVYRDLLGRNATQEELDAVHDDLDAEIDRLDIIDSVLVSREYQEQQVVLAYETLIGRTPETGELEAWFPHQILVSETFNDDSLPDSLEIFGAADSITLGGGGVTTFADGQVSLSEQRHFLRTIESDFFTQNFTAETTITVSDNADIAAEDRIAFFGMGAGEPDPDFSDEPRTTPVVMMRIAPDDFLLDDVGSIDIVDDTTAEQAASDVGGTGTHRVRLVWDADSQTATFAIDQDYTGGPFDADLTLDPLDGSDNGFDATNARIFFGGSGDVSFDDFEITGDALPIDPYDIPQAVISSDEYFQGRGSSIYEGFAEAMHQEVVGRPPSETELGTLVDDLTAGIDRGELVSSIALANEATAHHVSGLVDGLLRRPAELFELVDTARMLQDEGSAAVINSIVASEEYYTRYGTQTSADSRSADEIEQDLILDWLTGEATPGNSVATTEFDSVGIVSFEGRGHGGGTLISPEYVLTAAHLVATRDISDLRFTVGGTSYGIADIEIHPGYSLGLLGSDAGNDIAVLRLNRAVVNVEPTPLWTGGLKTGEELTLVGYGLHPGDEAFGTKRVGTTEIDGLTPHLVTWTYDNGNEATTVPGDSGSPQFIFSDGQYHLASVASGGTHQTLAIGDFAYNTRVDSYFQWIVSVIKA